MKTEKLQTGFIIFIYTWLVWEFVCFLVCFHKRKNDWTDRIQHFKATHMTSGEVYGCSEILKMCFPKVRFSCNLENLRKISWNSRTFYLYCFIFYGEKMLIDKVTFKFEVVNGRQAALKLSKLKTLRSINQRLNYRKNI